MEDKSNERSSGNKRERGKRAASSFRNLGDNSVSSSSDGSENRSGDSESGSGDGESGSGDSAITDSKSDSGNRKSSFTIVESGNEDGESNSSVGSERGNRDNGSEFERDRSDRGNTDESSAEGRISNESEGIPNISFGDIFSTNESEKKRGRGRPKGSVAGKRVTLNTVQNTAQLFKLIHEVPSGFGLGEHWRLGDAESEQLASAFLHAVGAIDDKKWKAFLKMLEKITPWGTLAFVAYTIEMPRIQLSLKLINESKRKAGEVSDSNTEDVRNGPSGFTRPVKPEAIN